VSLIKHLKQLARLTQPRTLNVHLGPQQLRYIARRGQRTIDGSSQHISIDNPNGNWQASVDALRILLRQQTAQWRGLPLEISVSGRWSQMLLAPWSDALLSEPSATRFLQSQMTALYGDAARGWRIASDDAPYGQARAASGVDSTLLQALIEASAECGHPCRVVEPALGAVLRLMEQRGDAMPAALALVETGRITMAALNSGRIKAIQSQPSGGTWTLELPQAWQRWTMRAPELAVIAQVAVIDLDAATAQAAALPARFLLADSPFGTPPAPSMEDAA
jgi:hypothetical protein